MEYAGLIIVVITLIVSIAGAYREQIQFAQKNPSLRPYMWGYFIGYCGIVSGILYSLLFFYHGFTEQYANEEYFLWGIIMLAFSYPFYLIVKRTRVGWILGSLLCLNPITWVINFIYGRNRWQEFSPPKMAWVAKVQARAARVQTFSFPARLLIATALFWPVCVVSFNGVFSPYGEYMNDRDFSHLLKVIFFPPVLMGVGYFLYKKVLKPQG